ncbi:hypothetical protein WNY79_13790 [Pseudoalteromonas sp. AS84]|uniref:hypothetical protein n=1 Tax=Pseudoalteromonas TaxID=53246 RepID=UPI000C32B258|nr:MULTISPECIES: hypothetical protein [Pseudoalteromonas]PKG68327.1 hypothetical protein CXF75_01290 [Pseudoalteromonas arctica]PKG71557.1 hypothetical protein CXF64_05140 [Pseudoalteromonas sp. GutCa3]
MLKKTIYVLLGSLVLQGCVDSHSVTAVVKNSVKFQSGDMLIYDVDIESSKHSCTILLSVMGKDLWALEKEESLLKGLACINKEGLILSGPPDVDSFTWKPVEGGFEFTMDATATEQNNKSEKLNIYTTFPLFVPLTKDLK